MVGRSLEQLYPPRTSRAHARAVARGQERVRRRDRVKDIDLTVHRGEVLGLFGLMGSGRTELVRILFGLDAFDAGEIVVDGRRRDRRSPRRSVRDGVAFVTENRREEGLLMSISIADNLALASLSRFGVTPLDLIDQTRLLDATGETATRLGIKAGDIARQPVLSLSGGNQQKVVIGRWLMAHPTTVHHG